MRSSRINCSLTTEFKLVAENISLQNERITQIYVIQSQQNPFLWFGVLFVDTGIFIGSVIRFNMLIDETYPDCACPKIVFSPIPYHPLINLSTGELDTKNAFPNWNSNHNKIHELLLFVKRVIRQANEYIDQIVSLVNQSLAQNHHTDNQVEPHKEITQREIEQREGNNSQDNTLESYSNNDLRDYNNDTDLLDLFSFPRHTLDFVKTYENNYDEFGRRIEEFKQECCRQLLDRPALSGDDENALVFSPWNPEVHEPFRKCILAGRFTPTNLFASYHKKTDSVSFVPGHEL